MYKFLSAMAVSWDSYLRDFYLSFDLFIFLCARILILVAYTATPK